MFTKSIITKTPKGNYHFVGRVHKDLMDKSFKTIDDAKVAAMDIMIETGEAFPVDVQAV